MCLRIARISLIISVALLALDASAASPVYDTFERANEFWINRDDARSLNKAIALFEEVLAMNPDSALEHKTRVLLSRAYYWRGNSMSPKNKEARKQAYSKGMEVLKPLLDANPADHEANFWYTVNMSSHGREVGVVKSAFLLSEITRRLKIVNEKDRWYFYGGLNRLLARLIQRSPGFIRKAQGYELDDAEKMLKENIERYPFFFMNRLFLAELYAEEERIEEACEQLEFLANSDAGTNPAYAANNRRDIRKARKLLSELKSKYPNRCGPARKR